MPPGGRTPVKRHMDVGGRYQEASAGRLAASGRSSFRDTAGLGLLAAERRFPAPVADFGPVAAPSGRPFSHRCQSLLVDPCRLGIPIRGAITCALLDRVNETRPSKLVRYLHKRHTPLTVAKSTLMTHSGHSSQPVERGCCALRQRAREADYLSGSPALRRPSIQCSASSGRLNVSSIVPLIVHLGSMRRTSAASALALSMSPSWA
jgi:hypothetical protein